ncbi:MAG TPA: inositol monophosphatase family protein [Xanthobacteraceae bacterium]|nr:inositol monophosphatase family protein [Xanthobacteraceae bacterium]
MIKATQAPSDATLAEAFTAIAIEASLAILTVDFRKAGTHYKADNSPVTLADEAAHAVITKRLAELLSDVPVVSEEASEDWRGREVGASFVLVDPLDGTAEFLAGRLEYTVNIALVRHGVPTVGVVAAPALGLLWRGAVGHGAARMRFSVGDDGRPRRAEPIHTRPWPPREPVAAVSRTHFDALSAAFLQRLGPVREIAFGSALKFARLAEGAVDVYPRLAPTSEWDVAAGHALVTAAGGVVLGLDQRPVRYGRAHVAFRVDGFSAWGDPAAARRLVC